MSKLIPIHINFLLVDMQKSTTVDVRQHFGYSSSRKIGKKIVFGSTLSRMLALLLIVGFSEKTSS